MKKVFCLAMSLLQITLCLTGCDEHVHTYDRTWQSDETHHWKIPTCGCDIVEEYGEHVLGEDGFCLYCERPLSASTGVEYAVLENGQGAQTIDFFAYAGQTRVQVASHYEGLPVTIIGEDTFEGWDELTTIVLPETIVEIGSRAFQGCSALTDINLSDNLMKIGEVAFYGCENLKELNVPASVTSVGEFAFANCLRLQTVNISGNLTTLERGIFNGCNNLSQVTIGNGVKIIESSAFAHCRKLTFIKIPDGVEEIGDAVFNSCRAMKSIILPKTLTCIGDLVFELTAEPIIYYEGNPLDWALVEIGEGVVPEVYYYSETEPELNEEGTAYNGNFWRYVEGVPKIWEYENKIEETF